MPESTVNRAPLTLAAGTCATTLTTALVSGTPVTSLAVAALPQTIASGSTVQIGVGTTGTDVATLSAQANAGATSLSVTSYTPSASWAIGTSVAPNVLTRNTATGGWPGDTGGPASADFRCVLTDTISAIEVVRVTGGQGTTALTVQRAAEPIGALQVPITVAAGASLAPAVTAGGLPALLANPSVVLEHLLADTTLDTILTLTPEAPGLFEVRVYGRVITATTTVTVEVTYTDAGGAQTATLVNAVAEPVGPLLVAPAVIASTAAAIAVKAQAGTASQVYLSAAIEAS